MPGTFDTTSQEVEREIKQMKANEVLGLIIWILKLLNYVVPYISSPLSYIFNIYYRKISRWIKIALVTHVYKSSEKSVLSSYRPISVLSCD